MSLTDIAKLHVLPPHWLEHDLSHADDRDLFLSLTEVIMSMTDIERLRVLLPHWLEHNAAHADDFRTWAERAQAAGEPHVAEHLAAAIEKLTGVSRDLQDALAYLGGAAEHVHAHPQ